MDDLPGIIEQLVARIEALERRVSALEHQRPVTASPSTPNPALIPIAAAASAAPALESASVFSILGRAMLGIAGAYLLRAAADSNLIPSPLAATIAIPYAIAWLVLAVRARAGAWFPSTVYAATSALILSPMLWELIFRFQIFDATGAAAVIAVYITAATALAWRPNLTSVFWVANLASVLIALGLFFAARSTLPFIALLLLMLALAAVAEARNRSVGGIRALNALAVSAAIWAAVYVYISPAPTRAEYPLIFPALLIVPAFALFAIYIASVVYSTVVRGRRISVLENILTVLAFLLVAVSLDAFAPVAIVYFGVLCLVLAAGGYTALYLFFDRAPQPRNYRVFSTWSAALVLVGCALALPTAIQTTGFSLAAVAATALAARFSRFVLVFHGAVYLAAAAAASSLAAYILHSFAGALPTGLSSWSVYTAFIAAILCYAATPRPETPSWQMQALQLLIAALTTCAAAALLVQVAIGLISLHTQPGPHHLAFFRTFSMCAATLTLAWAGARFRRAELIRIANTALVLLAVKLIVEDLRQGRLAYIAASIFLYALTLIAVPRVSRQARKSRDAHTAPTAARNSPTVPPAAI